MLHEASSVAKAIEKAWTDSGRPAEFTVKVLEQEEKGFLGLTTKKPAIVSITYDPRKQQQNDRSQRDKKNFNNTRRDKVVRPVGLDREQFGRKDQQAPQANRQQAPQPQRHKFVEKEPAKAVEKPQHEVEGWNQEFVNQISVWLKEMLSIMNIQTTFTTKIDKKGLLINFDKNLLDSADDERLLFINMSFVLIQFLKKQHKKKFRGFHILLQSKNQAAHDKGKKPSSDQ